MFRIADILSEGPDKAASSFSVLCLKCAFTSHSVCCYRLMTQYKHVACISNYMSSVVFSAGMCPASYWKGSSTYPEGRGWDYNLWSACTQVTDRKEDCANSRYEKHIKLILTCLPCLFRNMEIGRGCGGLEQINAVYVMYFFTSNSCSCRKEK